MRTPAVLVLLALAPLLPTAAALDAPEAASAGSLCVQLASTADDAGSWICVDPKGGACAVHFREQHGTTVTEECLLDDVYVVPPSPRCVLLAQDLDYAHYLCVDPNDASCLAYLWRTSGSHETRTCVGVPPRDVAATDASGLCVPTSGGLDYPSYVCVDPKNPRCAVYRVTTSDWGTTKTCIPGV